MHHLIADFTLMEFVRGVGYALLPYLILLGFLAAGGTFLVRGFLLARRPKKAEENAATSSPWPSLLVGFTLVACSFIIIIFSF